jgi:hypothetical protein
MRGRGEEGGGWASRGFEWADADATPRFALLSESEAGARTTQLARLPRPPPTKQRHLPSPHSLSPCPHNTTLPLQAPSPNPADSSNMTRSLRLSDSSAWQWPATYCLKELPMALPSGIDSMGQPLLWCLATTAMYNTNHSSQVGSIPASYSVPYLEAIPTAIPRFFTMPPRTDTISSARVLWFFNIELTHVL